MFEGQAKASADESFDADAAIATGELAPMIDDLIEALGGEQVIGGAAPVAQAPSTATATPATPAATSGPAARDVPPWEDQTA